MNKTIYYLTISQSQNKLKKPQKPRCTKKLFKKLKYIKNFLPKITKDIKLNQIIY